MNEPFHQLFSLVKFSSPFPTPILLPLFPRKTPTHPPSPYLSESLHHTSHPVSLVMAHSASPLLSLLRPHSPSFPNLPTGPSGTHFL